VLPPKDARKDGCVKKDHRARRSRL
jgi:hypothetical protein